MSGALLLLLLLVFPSLSALHNQMISSLLPSIPPSALRGSALSGRVYVLLLVVVLVASGGRCCCAGW